MAEYDDDRGGDVVARAKSLVGGTHSARNVILASFAGGVTMISLQEINILTTRARKPVKCRLHQITPVLQCSPFNKSY